MDLKRRLTKKERDEFEALMEVRDPLFTGPMQGSITRVHGFLTSIASGPMVMPSEWIPVVFGLDEDSAWETMEQAQRATSVDGGLKARESGGEANQRRHILRRPFFLLVAAAERWKGWMSPRLNRELCSWSSSTLSTAAA
jgi:hypothetical protein